jgi:hypothetical protein
MAQLDLPSIQGFDRIPPARACVPASERGLRPPGLEGTRLR